MEGRAISPIETAVRIIVDLLVRGQYETATKATGGMRLTAAELSGAVSTYGRRLVPPGDGWWSLVEVTPITGDVKAYHVTAPLWTLEEGRSDLTLELRLSEFAPSLYNVEILDLHVL